MKEDNPEPDEETDVDSGTIPLPDDFQDEEAELSIPEVLDFDRWEPRKPATDAVLWRYIDFTQLVSILENESIWFNNIENFIDPYEGIWRKSNGGTIESDDDEMSEEEKSYVKNNLIYVSCWHLNPGESAALWEQYIEGDTGVAIRTTVGSLQNQSKRISNR